MHLRFGVEKVSLAAIDYSRTYASVLAGHSARIQADDQCANPSKKQAMTGCDSRRGAKRRMLHVCSGRKWTWESSSDPRRLHWFSVPPVQLRAWLTCYQPVDPTFMASDLVVLWFTEECHSECLGGRIWLIRRVSPQVICRKARSSIRDEDYRLVDASVAIRCCCETTRLRPALLALRARSQERRR